MHHSQPAGALYGTRFRPRLVLRPKPTRTDVEESDYWRKRERWIDEQFVATVRAGNANRAKPLAPVVTFAVGVGIVVLYPPGPIRAGMRGRLRAVPARSGLSAYQFVGLVKDPRASVRVAGNWLALSAPGRIGL